MNSLLDKLQLLIERHVRKEFRESEAVFTEDDVRQVVDWKMDELAEKLFGLK